MDEPKSLAQCQLDAELLFLVQHWRERAEKAEAEISRRDQRWREKQAKSTPKPFKSEVPF